MTDYYECQITMVGDPAIIEPAVQEIGWIFSKIDGDPVLGPGVKCYATKMFNAKNEYNKILRNLHGAAASLALKEIPHTRLKIERVVYDVRS